MFITEEVDARHEWAKTYCVQPTIASLVACSTSHEKGFNIMAMNFKDRLCSAAGCENEALIPSEPPLCGGHIGDVDAWYYRVQQQVLSPEVEEGDRVVLSAFARNGYMHAVSSNPIAGELYQDFKSRAEPPEYVAYSYEQFVTLLAHFFIQSAASGVIGNLSYDALKVCVTDVLNKLRGGLKADDDKFSEVVERKTYEEIRSRIHLKIPALGEFSRETVKITETKYHNIVKEEFEKDPKVLYRPKRSNELEE